MPMTEALLATAQMAAAPWGAHVRRLIVARENAVFEVTLPGGRRGALRLHRTGYQSQPAIRSELWWCAELAAKGLPVPSPVTMPTGEILATLPDGRLVSVVEWLDGTPIGSAGVPLPQAVDRQIDLHHRLGLLLRQVHSASDGLNLPNWFVRPLWNSEGLVGEAPFWGRFWEHPDATPEQREILVAARTSLRQEISRHAALGGSLGLIHADVLRENVLLSGDALSLIDFDDSGIGYRLYDLGTVLSQNQYEAARDDLRDALMAGYGTDDTAMVEIFTLARTMASVGWTMPRLAADDPIHQSHLARAVTCARRVLR